MYGNRRLRCYPHSTAAAAVLYCRLPEWEDMRFMLDYLGDGDIFIDVGSNVGAYTLLASAIEGVDIIAFEPSTENRWRLEENVRINGLDRRVEVVGHAVGAHGGEAAFTIGLDTVNHLVEGNGVPPSAAEHVRVVTLDGAVSGVTRRRRVALVKIDVEGTEALVLAGAEAMIAESSPSFIVERNDPTALGTFFADHGYVTCQYDPMARMLETCSISDATGNNVIAVRNIQDARARLEAAHLEA
jgi:FkbM family methyltransferase